MPRRILAGSRIGLVRLVSSGEDTLPVSAREGARQTVPLRSFTIDP